MRGETNPPTPQGWRAEQYLGCGCTGSVYRILRDSDGARAAMKVISIPTDDREIPILRSKGYDEETISRILTQRLTEIYDKYDILKQMNGESNNVSVRDVIYRRHQDGSSCDVLVVTEELIPLCKTLDHTYSESRVLEIAKGVLGALERYGQYRIMHGAIKPENVLVSSKGEYKVSDFGVSDQLAVYASEMPGDTCDFMAPEIYLRRPYDARADIYSVGMLLYWLCNNYRIPFLPEALQTLTEAHFEEANAKRVSGSALPKPMFGSDMLKRLIAKACAYDPKDRYQSAGAMLIDLKKIIARSAAASSAPVFTAPEAVANRLYAEPVPRERKPIPIQPTYRKEPSDKPVLLFDEDFVEKRRKREPEAPEAGKTPKKKHTFGIAMAILGLLIVIAGITIVIMVLMRREDEPVKNGPTAVPNIMTMKPDITAVPFSYTGTPEPEPEAEATPAHDDPHAAQTEAAYTTEHPDTNSTPGNEPDPTETADPQGGIVVPTTAILTSTPTFTPTPKPTATPFPTVAPAPEGEIDGKFAYVIPKHCNVRTYWSSNNEQSAVMKELDRGDVVEIKGHHENWTLIQVDSIKGWVYDDFLYENWMLEDTKYAHGLSQAGQTGIELPTDDDKMITDDSKVVTKKTDQANVPMYKKPSAESPDEAQTGTTFTIRKKGKEVVVLKERVCEGTDAYGEPIKRTWYFCLHQFTDDGVTYTYFGWIEPKKLR